MVTRVPKGPALKSLKKALGLNTENKSWDAVYSSSITTNLSSFQFPTAGLGQGLTNNTRIGNGIRVTHWKYQARMANNILNGNQTRYRVIITLQKQVNLAGNSVTAAQLLQDTTNIDSPYNSDLTDVKVLHDKTYQLRPYYSGQVASNNFTFRWSPSYDDGHIVWTEADTSGSSAGLLQGILKIFCMCDTPANQPIFYTYSRIHYVDN